MTLDNKKSYTAAAVFTEVIPNSILAKRSTNKVVKKKRKRKLKIMLQCLIACCVVDKAYIPKYLLLSEPFRKYFPKKRSTRFHGQYLLKKIKKKFSSCR